MMEQTKFLMYESIRKQGKTNMYDAPRVTQLSGGLLGREDIMDIMKNYSAYSEQWLSKKTNEENEMETKQTNKPANKTTQTQAKPVVTPKVVPKVVAPKVVETPKVVELKTRTKISQIWEFFDNSNYDITTIVAKTGASPSTVKVQMYKYKKQHK